MIDLESMIKSLRLAWLKRIFGENDGAWKNYLRVSTVSLLRQTFNLSVDHVKKIFWLPHKVSFEPYIKAFQYKVLNLILYTNTKLFKIGYISDDKCSFCKSEPETP